MIVAECSTFPGFFCISKKKKNLIPQSVKNSIRTSDGDYCHSKVRQPAWTERNLSQWPSTHTSQVASHIWHLCQDWFKLQVLTRSLWESFLRCSPDWLCTNGTCFYFFFILMCNWHLWKLWTWQHQGFLFLVCSVRLQAGSPCIHLIATPSFP